jgi:hypothetical protein
VIRGDIKRQTSSSRISAEIPRDDPADIVRFATGLGAIGLARVEKETSDEECLCVISVLSLSYEAGLSLLFDVGSRPWHWNANAHPLSSIVQHIKCFCCAVRQVDTPLNIHLGQKWAAIFDNNTDAATTQAYV